MRGNSKRWLVAWKEDRLDNQTDLCVSPDSHQLHDPRQVTYPEIWVSFTQTGNYTYFERMLRGLNKVMCVKVQNRCPEEMTYPQFPQGNSPSQLCSNLYRRERGSAIGPKCRWGHRKPRGRLLILFLGRAGKKSSQSAPLTGAHS